MTEVKEKELRKVAVYLRINSNNEEEMKKEEERVKSFCAFNNLGIEEMIKDYVENKTIEDVLDYLIDNNEVSTLVTNRLSMLSDNIYELYDYYYYLDKYCFCDLVSAEELDKYRFEIKLINEREVQHG